MSGCRWRSYFAIGGLVLSLASPLAAQESPERPAEAPTPIEEGQGVAPDAPTPQNEGGEGPTSNQTEPAESVDQPPTVENQRTAEEAAEAHRETAEQREKDDLIAQRSMAKSATDLVDLTFWQIIVGALGILLIGSTLYYTRKAVWGATRAAKAAEAAVRVASDTAERQLRAYVSINEASIAPGPTDTSGPTIRIKFVNSGQTPANDLEGLLTTGFHPVPLQEELTPYETQRESKLLLGPNQSASTAMTRRQPFSQAELKAIQDGSGALYVWGRVDYKDIFGTDRRTNFRFLTLHSAEGNVVLVRHKDGNDGN